MYNVIMHHLKIAQNHFFLLSAKEPKVCVKNAEITLTEETVPCQGTLFRYPKHYLKLDNLGPVNMFMHVHSDSTLISTI